MNTHLAFELKLEVGFEFDASDEDPPFLYGRGDLGRRQWVAEKCMGALCRILLIRVLSCQWRSASCAGWAGEPKRFSIIGVVLGFCGVIFCLFVK